MNQDENDASKSDDVIDQIAKALKDAELENKADPAQSSVENHADSIAPPHVDIDSSGTDSFDRSGSSSSRSEIPEEHLATAAGGGIARSYPYSPLYMIPGFQFIREIGRGGQAAVFEAIQLSTGQKVAIKILRDGLISSPQDLARFDREIRILAALNHPNIVHVIDGGQTAHGGQYLVMAFVHGVSLGAWLKEFRANHPGKRKPEQLTQLLTLFLKICDAVNAAHLRGVVHRDLKPSNLIVDERGEPHVLDFGLARTALSTLTKEKTPDVVSATGQFIGSLPWASPEQARGIQSQIDMRTDVYSLGVILYQMITGYFPYDVSGSIPEVMHNILSVTPIAPSRREGKSSLSVLQQSMGLSRSTRFFKVASIRVLDAIVLKALSKRPEDRYLSAGELARDITNLLSERPTLAAGDAARWRRLLKTSLIPLGVLVLAVVALVIGGGLGRWTFSNVANQFQAAFHRSPSAAIALETRRNSDVQPGPTDVKSPPVSPDFEPVVGSLAVPAFPYVVTIGIASERSKIDWLRRAILEFNKTSEGRSIEIRLYPMSGTASVRAILDGDQRIDAIMPSNAYLVDVFVEHWKALYGKTPMLRVERLALSPMLFLLSQAALDAINKKHSQVSFRSIRDLIVSGFEPDHASEFKFGYANPMESLDGDASLALMCYEFADKNKNLSIEDAQNPQFRSFLKAFTANPSRIASNPSSLVQDMILLDGNRFDCILVPESAIVAHLDSAPGKFDSFQLAYPKRTVCNDHPAYILDVPWTTDAQKKAASLFVDYLISEPAQKMAMESGLRPVNLNVSLSAPGSPFVRFADHGIRLDFTELCDPPSSPVMQSLQATWVLTRSSGQKADHPSAP